MDIIKKAELSQKREVTALKQKSQEKEKPKDVSETLMGYVTNGGSHLFFDQFQTPCFSLPTSNFMAYKLDSHATRHFLTYRYWQDTKKTLNKDTINSAIITLEARAIHSGNQEFIHNRVAMHNGMIYFDIGDNKQVIKISSDGWSIETDAPVYFRRYPHQKKQVIPEKGTSFKDLLEYINIKNEYHQLLILSYIPVCLISDIPRALITLSGDQGAGKSLCLKFIRELVDPSEVPIIASPDSLRELVQFASHNYIVYLDNLSKISDWLSDGLCRLVTGDGFSKRQLYTDDDDILYSYKRVVGMCGINQVATKADLLDRCLIIPLERILDHERKEEQRLWRKFKEEKSKLFGAMLDILSASLKLAPRLEIKSSPRMADYYRFASAAAVSLGYSQNQIDKAFNLNLKYQNREAIETSTVAQIILTYMNSGKEDEWEGKSSELHKVLKPIAEDLNLKGNFPSTSNWLWRKIVEVRPNLMAYGIQTSKRETSEGSIIKLYKQKTNGSSGNNGNNEENITKEAIDRLFSENSPL